MKLDEITQEEAFQAIFKYKHKELLELVAEAIELKRKDEEETDKNQTELPLEDSNK